MLLISGPCCGTQMLHLRKPKCLICLFGEVVDVFGLFEVFLDSDP